MGLAETAKTGDDRKTLEALRDELATALEEAGPNVKANIAGQLRATLADLRALPAAAGVTPAGVVTIADAKAKRAQRQSAAAAPAAKAGGSKRR